MLTSTPTKDDFSFHVFIKLLFHVVLNKNNFIFKTIFIPDDIKHFQIQTWAQHETLQCEE